MSIRIIGLNYFASSSSLFTDWLCFLMKMEAMKVVEEVLVVAGDHVEELLGLCDDDCYVNNEFVPRVDRGKRLGLWRRAKSQSR